VLLDSHDRPLYIGRAGNLRERVRSYWAPRLDRPRLRRMVVRVRSVRTVLAVSEHEAAFLERALLERYEPPFNRTLGLESVVALRLEPSSLTAVHDFAGSTARHFGPYLGWAAAFAATSALVRLFPLHYCRPAAALTSVERDLARRRGVGPDDGADLTGRIVAVLNGDAAAVADAIAGTEAARDRASELGLYERAAELQAEIAGLRWITQPQSVASFHDAAGWLVREELLPRFGAASAVPKVEW
jgi:excinuclease UvrABC nuclease subunit